MNLLDPEDYIPTHELPYDPATSLEEVTFLENTKKQHALIERLIQRDHDCHLSKYGEDGCQCQHEAVTPIE